MFFFSPIYPLERHFFCVTALDRSKTWNHLTTAIMDVPTAYAFFGADPQATLNKLSQLVGELTSSWNRNQEPKERVSHFWRTHFFLFIS